MAPKKTNNDNEGKEKRIVKGLGFCGIAADANTVEVDVANGKIIRINPLHYDRMYQPAEFNPWKIEARGKVFEPSLKSLIPPLSLGYKNRVYSPNRILYPLKRADWDPGNRNTQNRGKSGYVRISWDEATDIIVSELRRIKETYGMEAVLSQSDGHAETKTVHAAHGCHRKLLKLLGGFTLQTRNTDSWEGWVWGAKHVWGMENLGQMVPVTNVIADMSQNTELILFWGCDPETTPWGWGGQLASRGCYWFTELGIESVYICPDLNYGAAVHADTWIPIRPNTDAALQLAIAYVWITEGTYDKEYVATHSVGFEKFQEYVLGAEDNIPKTPEWAAEITGIPSRTIKVLAHKWASKRTTIAHGNGGPYIRGPYSTEPARLEVLLLAMQGLGKPGCHQVKMMEWSIYQQHQRNPWPRPLFIPNLQAADRGWKYEDTPRQFIPKCLIHDAILHPPITWSGTTTLSRDPVEKQFIQSKYPVDGCPEIHMIWTDTPCLATCWNDSNSILKAYRHPKIEFIMAQHPWLENDCLFADIILPSNTKFETEDIGVDIFSGQFDAIFYEHQCIEPRGESKSDYEVVCTIAEKLGLLEEYTGGKSVAGWIKHGYETSGVSSYISFEDLKKKGYWMVPTAPDWQSHKAGMKSFYDDPEQNPLTTPSGKIEFYSERLARHFPDDKERPPVPHWVPYGESHQESLLHPRAQKYPLLICSNHPRWRIHAQHDDMTWLREIPTCKVKGPDGYLYEPLWLHPSDALKRDIRGGDVVKIYNERGVVLSGARLTERIMPGTVYIDHGARYDPIVPGELDRGGAINTICPHNVTSKHATGQVASGYLVEVEKVDIEEMRRKYPAVFERPYDQAAGLCLERFLSR